MAVTVERFTLGHKRRSPGSLLYVSLCTGRKFIATSTVHSHQRKRVQMYFIALLGHVSYAPQSKLELGALNMSLEDDYM